MHPNRALFAQTLELILTSWSALSIAIEHAADPSDATGKRTLLHASLVDYFSQHGRQVEVEDLEDILVDVLGDEFGVILEDGSEREVAKMIWESYREAVQGKRAILDELLRRRATREANRCSISASQMVNQVEELTATEASEYSDDSAGQGQHA